MHVFAVNKSYELDRLSHVFYFEGTEANSCSV